MSGAIPPSPLYAFVSRTETTLPLIFALLLVSGNNTEERRSCLLGGVTLESHNFEFFFQINSVIVLTRTIGILKLS